jgi:WD40 repeat protein
MRSWLRSKRVTLVLAVLVWATGCLAIWWALPPAPRIWQPAAGQEPLGFLSDGRTLVTVACPHNGYKGPIQLWDTNSGRARASYFGHEDTFQSVVLDRNEDRLRVIQLQENEEASPLYHYLLRIHDAWTGRELVRFSCHSSTPEGDPLYHISFWIVTPDGKTTAFVCIEDNQVQIELHDVASGRLLLRLPGPADRMVFSPNGRRFASNWGGTVTIWEVPTGREIASFTVPSRGFNCAVGDHGLKDVSPDGQLVLDQQGGVWDAATGKLRFQLPGECASCTFSADGRSLVVLQPTAIEHVLDWYDMATGEVQPGRRLPLGSPVKDSIWLQQGTPDGRLLVARSYHQGVPSFVGRQLSRLPGFQSLAVNPGRINNYLVIDEERRQVITRGTGSFWDFNAQGNLFLTTDQHQKFFLWDFPPRKSLASFLALAGALGMSLVVLVGWRLRRQQPDLSAPACNQVPIPQ